MNINTEMAVKLSEQGALEPLTLTDAQKKVLNDAALWLEGLDNENDALIKAERDKQATAGIQPIDLGAAAGKEFLAKANEVGWASVIKRSPENGAKLRQLAGN